MNLNDDYLNESENFNKYLSQLRNEILKKNRNPNVNMENFDKQIKKLIEEGEGSIKRIKEILLEVKQNKSFSFFENDRRSIEFEERKKEFYSLKNEYYYSLQGQRNNDQLTQYMNLENPQEYYIKLKEERNHIDQNVLEMTNTVKQIRKTQTDLIGDVLSNQNKLAEATDKKMDKAKIKLDKTKQRLTQYLETSSNPCLGFIIFIEIAILILVIITV